jgi:hypothetical protein
MEIIEAIVNLTKELNIASTEKEKRFIKTKINQLSEWMHKADKIADIEKRVGDLESKISFIRREG